MKKQKSCPITMLYNDFTDELKHLRRRTRLLKLKIILLFVLPLLILLIAVSVVKTYARIKIREHLMKKEKDH